jgi:glycosyltransferase involved in cell wall biosynthesis
VDFHNSYKESRTTALQSRLHRAETSIYRSCDGIVCSTEDAQRQVIDFAGVPREKILVLPNAVDADIYDPSRYRPMRQFDAFTVGFVGSLYPWQGLELLFEAIHDIKARGQVDIRVLIVGDGIHRHALERQVVELGLVEEVEFVGQVAGPKAAELLLGCDVSYVGHQISESGDLPFSPIKLYESMSLALPVIAPAVPQFSNIIVPDQEGFLFAPNDLESLIRALTRASRAGQALRTMGQRGRIQVVQKHSWPQRVELLLKWLQDDRELLPV